MTDDDILDTAAAAARATASTYELHRSSARLKAHNICERDWFVGPHGVLPDGAFRKPVRVKDKSDVCCYCGTPTVSGIYVRDDDAHTLCGGEHERPELWSPVIAAV